MRELIVILMVAALALFNLSFDKKFNYLQAGVP